MNLISFILWFIIHLLISLVITYYYVPGTIIGYFSYLIKNHWTLYH